MSTTSARPVYRMVVAAATLLAALVVAGCSGAPSTDTAAPGNREATATLLSAAGRSSAGLVAIAQLGQRYGANPDVVALGTRLAAAGQTLLTDVQRIGSGSAVDTAAPATVRNAVGELLARTGPDFDPAWLAAVTDQAKQARAAAAALMAAPGTSDDTMALLRPWVTEMDAALGATDATARPAGASAPTAVAAGDGGLLAPGVDLTSAAVGLGLVALGGVLLAGALRRRRTTS